MVAKTDETKVVAKVEKVVVALDDIKVGQTVYSDLVGLAQAAGISMARAGKTMADELCIARKGRKFYSATVAQPLLKTAAETAAKPHAARSNGNGEHRFQFSLKTDDPRLAQIQAIIGVTDMTAKMIEAGKKAAATKAAAQTAGQPQTA